MPNTVDFHDRVPQRVMKFMAQLAVLQEHWIGTKELADYLQGAAMFAIHAGDRVAAEVLAREADAARAAWEREISYLEFKQVQAEVAREEEAAEAAAAGRVHG